MIDLYVSKNLVFLNKRHPEALTFIREFLTKFEETLEVDYIKTRNNRGRKQFKSVKKRRNLYTESGDLVIFARGILSLIPPQYYRIISEPDSSDLIIPDLTDDEIKNTLKTFPLRKDQILAVKKGLLAKRGVIQLPTATGKSAIITSIIKRLHEANPNMKSLVIAPTLSTVEGINNTLKKNGLSTAIFAHPDKEIKTPITTALVQSLVAVGDESLLTDINAVFYDECLPANSKILLSDFTEKTISEIYNDDSIQEVMSFNLKTYNYESKRILRKFKTPFNDRFCKVYYEDIDGKLKGITCTPTHKIYVKNCGDYLPAEEIKPGDLIQIDYPFTRNWKFLYNQTFRPVKRVTYNVGRKAEYKYNIEVEDNHNYFANSVLVSNCHHLKCETWNSLNTLLPNAEYSLGFSALSVDKDEIYARDFRDLSYNASLIIGSAGPVIMHMDPKYYIDNNIIALPVLLRIKHNVDIPNNVDPSDWHKISKIGLQSTVRTGKIVQVASMFAKYNRKVLILVSEREYAFYLCKFLAYYGEDSWGISFGAGTGYSFGGFLPLEDNQEDPEVNFIKEDSLEMLDRFSNGEINILVGTSHIDEGVDLSNLDVVILANGGKQDRRIIQRVGRVLRKSKTGKYAYIVDFTDEGTPVLSRQSKTRLKLYKEDIGVPEENIFDGIQTEYVESKFKELEGLN